jgi:cytochrome c-type biogenesis protein CcmH
VSRLWAAAALAAASLAVAQAAEEPAPSGADSARSVAEARAVVGAPAGAPLSGAALDAAVYEIASVLRCPVCQGLSVADSPTDLARNMKQQVRDLLAAGYTREQVLRYFESSYGEFVRLQPPLRGVNWLVWAAPLLGLLGGGYIVARALRHGGGAEAPAAAPAGEEDPELAPYLLRVRELAYGWPGGRRPGSPEADRG